MNRTEVLPTAPVKRPQAGEPALGLDNYEIGHQIARGGMGSILKAGDTKLKREVAIKIMALDAIVDAGMRQRFLREAEVLAMLAHPNIVPIHDIVWEDGAPLFYSMKLVKGQTLQAILHDLAKGHPDALREYTLDRLLLIFRKVCDAIAFAHSKGVLHRDLKPDNIMVGEFGEVLVMDWGLAKLMGERSADTLVRHQISDAAPLPDPWNGQECPRSLDATLQGSVMGTPQYMSPEQARGEVDALDERSDVFSLGAILYAILTLRPPVEGQTAQEVLEKVTRGQITPPSSLKTMARSRSKVIDKGAVLDAKQIRPLAHLAGGRVPSALSSVVMHALQLDKEQRYPSVIAFIEDIEAYQGGFATRAQQAGALRQMQLLVLRHKVIATSLAVLLLFSVGFVLKVMASERHAQQSLAKAQISVAEAAFRRADVVGMVRALDETSTDWRGQSWDYLSAKRDSSLGLLKVEGFTNLSDMCAVPGAPGQFAISNREGQIGFVDAATQTLLRTIDTGDPGQLWFSISGDGQRLLSFTMGGSQARLFDLITGEQVSGFAAEYKERLNSNAFSRTSLNRTGSLAGISGVEVTQFQVFETATGKVRLQGNGGNAQLMFHPDDRHLFVLQPFSGNFDVYDLTDGTLISSSRVGPWSMALNADGTVMALGLYTGELALVDAKTGRELRRAQLHTSSISAVAWTAAGNLLTLGGESSYGSASKSLRMWDPERFAPRGTFFGLAAPSFALGASLCIPSGCLLTRQSPPQLWRFPDLPLGRVEHASDQGWSCTFLSDTVLLARGGVSLKRYDVSNPGQPLALTPAHYQWHELSAAHPASGLFAIAKPGASGPNGVRSTARMMRLTPGGFAEIWAHPLSDDVIACMDLDSEAKRLLLVPKTGGLHLLAASDGETLFKHQLGVDLAAFAGTGQGIVALERPRREGEDIKDRILVIDPATGEIRHSVISPNRLNALAVSPDRRLVAVAGDDQIVVILDADTLSVRHRFRAHDAAITALKFHPSRPILASGSADFSIKLWDYATAKLRQTFLGLDGRPVAISFSPSGKLLAVDGMEKSFRIYAVEADD